MRRLLRSWRWRVAVSGHSMEPTLHDGDWLLVDPAAFATRAPRIAELVVVDDPRQPGRWLIKRVATINPDDTLALAGDHPAHATKDDLAAVPASAVMGRPWLRYWPPRRLARLGRPSARLTGT